MDLLDVVGFNVSTYVTVDVRLSSLFTRLLVMRLLVRADTSISDIMTDSVGKISRNITPVMSNSFASV